MNILITYAKILWIGLNAGLATVVLFLPIILCALLSRTGNLAINLTRLWAWFMLFVTGVHPSIRGREKIVPGQSYVIISNHQSQYDILALVTQLGLQFRWIIKQELLKVPLFGYALYASRNIFIDRSDTQRSVASIHAGMDRLPPEASVMFFAEGTRSCDGQIHTFKKGGFILALERGLPILPVTVNGSRKVLPKGSFAFSPGPIEVVVSDPIPTEGCTHADLEALIEKTRRAIVATFDPDYPGR